MKLQQHHAVAAAMFLVSFSLVLFELALVRLFGVVLFASFAHLALALAMLGISVGAVLQHLWPHLVPEEGLEDRLAWLSLLQGGTTIFSVLAVISLPITRQFEQAPVHYGERSSIAWNLIDPFWFTALLPILCLPFVVVGLSFAGTFQRRKEHIGLIYGCDLIGGAIAALLFVPLLWWVSAPDILWVVTLATCISAVLLWTSVGAVQRARLAVIPGVISLVLFGLASTGLELMKIRYAAGYAEENVTYTRWTPLTRLAVHEDERGTYMLLDNSSASEIIVTEERRNAKAKAAARAFVHRLHEPGARIAILAASAGPEVAVAQYHGHHHIDAVDIAAEIGDVVLERWPDSPVNPYAINDTRRVWSDGRAAILHAEEPYDIIQMVHANLHSAAGLLANAWSPNLLETTEAFHTYFDNLDDEGTLSFAAHTSTRHFARAAWVALKERGVRRPGDHFIYVGGNQIFMLVKKRPWTRAERDDVRRMLKDYNNAYIEIDPVDADAEKRRKMFMTGSVMTDNRPYFESPRQFRDALGRVVENFTGQSRNQARAIDIVYKALVLQALFVLVAGSLLVLVPLIRRGPAGLTDVKGVGWGLVYVSGLGYGYLAVETVLIHELVLFVGHPTYAVTAVIFTMLLFSGIGSVMVGRFTGDLTRKLLAVLGCVIALGAIQAWVVPGLLYAYALGLPVGVRVFLTGLALAPLGLVMGMPFPLALRVLRPEAAGMVPWAWAFNGWMSVVASLATVFISRLYGYDQAFGIALLAYVCALVLTPTLKRIGSE